MATGFQRLSIELAKLEPSLKANGNPGMGSEIDDHRRLIRASLQEYLPGEQGLEDLNSIPRPENWSISISHSKNFGGWLAVKRPKQVGFDCELQSRIRPEVIQRISTPEEIARCPISELLWGAKEAFYKALEKEQPVAITQMQIGEWKKLDSGVYAFSGDIPVACAGLMVIDEGLLFAGCIVSK